MKFNRSRQSWGRFYCTKLMHVLPYNASPHYLHHQEEVYVLSGKASGNFRDISGHLHISSSIEAQEEECALPSIKESGKLAAIGSVDDHVRVIWMSDVSDCTQIKHYVCLSSSCCLIYYNNPQS
ncbi:hypothetical protein CMV_014579 [Castanea mollissima]|uniref:Uncharacterized protein n=1 Tax=Castanea mollissima TaxID=60419 RepID=A0A8J4VTR0_9ROSI|nr:hypothetical protein CMV_014579 [Castanea mollissima]